ncbi:MAG: hypothetical protein WAM09_17130 [Anaerolineales bacterium]|jgi:hypothetical protein
MKKFSRQLVDIRIKYLLIPGVSISSQSSITFQDEIRKAGLEFSRFNLLKNAIIVNRDEPSPLQIEVAMGQPSQPPFCQLAIISERPNTGVEGFYRDAEAAVIAYQATWSSPAWQIIKCDAGMRELHETESEHAFKELWENRLGQSAKSLSIFGKLVRGGGLRFVLDPLPTEKDPVIIDIKIESYLQDVKKIFVETMFSWVKPNPPSPIINVTDRIISMNKYVEECITGFIVGGTNANDQ